MPPRRHGGQFLFAAEGRQAREGERLLGSSEVLESIIGKFKHVAGERGQHGLTGMVLSIGALVGNLAVATVQAAMTEIPTNAVWNWCRSHLGATLQSVRQRIRQALHPEQNQKTLRLESGGFFHAARSHLPRRKTSSSRSSDRG